MYMFMCFVSDDIVVKFWLCRLFLDVWSLLKWKFEVGNLSKRIYFKGKLLFRMIVIIEGEW